MLHSFKEDIRGKNVLITGGTGSFGYAAVKKLLDYNPNRIIVLSRDEKKQFDMGNQHDDDRLRFVIGDVRNRESLDHAMHSVDMVFHAAALKQVPNCEFFPVEALMTNSLGTHNVINAALRAGVRNVVVLSTDKAVHPINVMGMSKALAERIMIATSKEKRGQTNLCGTRYGNVMYTRGSVIPFFIDLMKQKKPLTLTDGSMTRFMMSIDDSIDLVLFALTNGGNGEIYVKKCPAATIKDLAQALAELFNYKKSIVEIGTRPGEKRHEMLISPEELYRAEDMGGYYKIVPVSPRNDYREYHFKGRNINDVHQDGYTSENTTRLTVKEIKKVLLGLPEIKKNLSLLRRGQFYK